MKKFLTISLLLTAAITATAQVSLQPVVPAVGMIQKTQLWNVLIANSSSVQYNCRLELVLKDRSTNLEVFTATTSLFALGAGAKQFNINSLGPVQYNYLSPGFDAKQAGLLPVGNYTACYSLTGTGEKAVNLADECIQFDIEPLSPPMLISPADSAILETAPAQFSWIPPAPDGMFSRLNYEIIITAIDEGQKAAEAIQNNVPFYSGTNIPGSVINYPPSSLAFEKDKWYAWQVIARDDRNYSGKTESWVFKVKDGMLSPIKTDDAPYLKMEKNNPKKGWSTDGILKLSYLNETNEKEITVQVSDVNDLQHLNDTQFKIQVRPGENLIQYDLNKVLRLRRGKVYQAEIINSRHEKRYVLFSLYETNKN